MPGIATYVDGAWFGELGFLHCSFVELERIEILRGPQGTLGRPREVGIGVRFTFD